tara:strand:+ start:301 stop:747 length:447 start_codon:yes stop_codon:yes gene_type:complete
MIKYLITFSLFLTNFILSENYDVRMLNQGSTGVMVFEPAVLRINLGDTVTFKATDAAHNSASIPGMLPDGASSWNGDLSRDIAITFEVPGIYGYQCTPHSMMAMVGVIQVGDNQSNLNSVKSAANIFKSKFVMNQSRLDDYLKTISTQ